MRVLSCPCTPSYLLRANPAVILDEHYHDFDEQAERLIGFDQSYLQLTPGPFIGRFLSCFLSQDISIHVEHCTQALEQSVAGHADAVTIGVLASEGAPFSLNGAAFTSDDVLIAMPGAALHLHSPVEGAVIAIVVQKDYFLGHAGLSPATTDWLMTPGFGTQLLNAAQLARRIREDVIQAIQSANFEQLEQTSAGNIGDALLSGLASKLSLEVAGAGGCMSNLLSPESYKKFLAGRNAIHQNWNAIHSVDDLLIETGFGRRSIQNSFTTHIALGPLSYHRVLRLHMARRALCDPNQLEATIGDIASRYDFWSWSQFTKLYQSHFGQLPSDTRAQAGLCA